MHPDILNKAIMPTLVEIIAANLRRLRTHKELTQKQLALSVGIPQGQYSRIENARVEPTLSTLEKIAEALEVPLTELVRQDGRLLEEEVNLTLLEKVRLLDELDEDERGALLKVIDMALGRKQLRESLQGLLASTAA